ncbi:MAG: ABC transporter permease [Actinobacteria bacterium]|nr:ABC transporter permease [Actinomycetota bacterium]MCI0543791.1 ABC transporter permease [Actinomycetota bacterium]
MLKFVSRRLVQMVGLFFLFLTLVFFLLQAQPGDISNLFIDPNLPREVQEQLRERLGLDGSVWSQWATYLTNFVRGNLGVSFSQYPRPVLDIILEALPRTMFLFTLATLCSYIVGFSLGKHLAWRRGGFSEYSVTIGGVLLYTVFYPWFAVIVILTFGSRLGWFPINGFLTPEFWRNAPYSGNQVFTQMILSLFIAGAIAAFTAWWARRQKDRRRARLIRVTGYGASLGSIVVFWALRGDMRPYALDIAHHSVLPVMTLTLVAFAGVMLLTRGSMLETLREDYILTARAKGVPERVIRDRHAARNALLPVVTSFVLGLAFIIGGGVVTETVFSWPGMGLLLLGSTVIEDVPLATGALAFIGILALVAHLVVDILYAVLDPRIRIAGGR